MQKQVTKDHCMVFSKLINYRISRILKYVAQHMHASTHTPYFKFTSRLYVLPGLLYLPHPKIVEAIRS